jgi:hypothetical protein
MLNNWPMFLEWVNMIQGGSWARGHHFHNYRFIGW